MEKSKKEIEKEILEYINKNNLCVLATSSRDIPKATPVGYKNEGLTLWITSDSKHGKKVKDILANPNVSVAIFTPYEGFGWDDAEGLQLWGKAEVITRESDEPQFIKGLEKMEYEKALESFGIEELKKIMGENYKELLIDKMALIKVIPEGIHFINSKVRRFYRVTWTKD